MLSIFFLQEICLFSNTKFKLLINPYGKLCLFLVSATCIQISPFEGISRLEEKGREGGKFHAHMQKGY